MAEYRFDFDDNIVKLLDECANKKGCTVEAIFIDALTLWCRSQPEIRRWWANHRYCETIICEHFPTPASDKNTDSQGTTKTSSDLPGLSLAQQLQESLAIIHEVREGTGAHGTTPKWGE
jgi:hypothetical protein